MERSYGCQWQAILLEHRHQCERGDVQSVSCLVAATASGHIVALEHIDCDARENNPTYLIQETTYQKPAALGGAASAAASPAASAAGANSKWREAQDQAGRPYWYESLHIQHAMQQSSHIFSICAGGMRTQR